MPLWITEADVTAVMSLPEAIGALERILALEAAGKAANLPKTHLMVGPNDAMHAIGASVAGAGLCGTKTWVNVGGKSDRKSTRLNSSHIQKSRMPSSA